MSNYALLISKLDSFTRKYYLNKTIKGGLYFLGLALTLFLLFNFLENQFYFDKGVRKVLFYSFGLSTLVSGYYWVIDPLRRYFRLGKTLSHEQAAAIIGQHFGDVEDKLLNILHLKKQENSSNSKELLFASIEQKTDKIKLVPFKSAIDLNKNRKYLKYALPPFLLLISVLFMAPSLIKDSTYRIVNNGQDFERAAPFHFNITNENLEAVQFSDFELNVQITGDVLPDEAFVEIEGFNYKLEKVDKANFKHVFRNLQKSTSFNLKSGKVVAIPSTINVLEKPNLTDFAIDLDYPSYTKQRDTKLHNNGDLHVPAGTKIKWNFNTINTDDIALKFGNAEPKKADQKSETQFEFKSSARADINYKVFYSNDKISSPDSLLYNIIVVPDRHPTIDVERFIDSTNLDVQFFAGGASDDYGLTNLTFNYTINNKLGAIKKQNTIKLNKPSGREAKYQYTFDINSLELKEGDQVAFYFEAFDNDGVNGIKSTKTQTLQFAKKTIEELKEQENLNEEEIKDALKNSKVDLKKMKENFRKMRENLLQKKEMDWQDKQDLEKLIEEQKKIQEKLEKAKEKMDENLKNQEELTPNEEIQQKQEKLNQMMEEALDPESKELMDKIQDLMQELEKEDALQMMEQFEMNNETMDKQMERLLELYKQLEMEKEVNEQVEKLEELAKKQEELAEETAQQEDQEEENSDENSQEENSDSEKDSPEDSEKDSQDQEGENQESDEEQSESDQQKQEELSEKQEDINKEFEDIQKKIEELEEQNEELSPPKNLGDKNEEKMDDIEQDLDDSKKELQKKNNKSASKSQKSAAGKMKKMAGDLQESMESGEQEQQAEDIKTIRQLLENLVTVSFDQEVLVNDFNGTPSTTPRFVDLVQHQFKLKDDFKVIEDSLVALSKRVDKIESFVTEKVTEIKYNMASGIDLLEQRQVAQAGDKQRRTMTNLNDLALMLSESMQDMQESMASGMPGSQSCEKPGGKGQGKSGKVPIDKITEGQQGMDGDLKGLQQKMGKEGKDGASAKDFAQAAAKQAAMRKALQDLKREKEEQGKGGGDYGDIIDQMNKIETELVNKRLNSETLKRQQDIVTRLLEAEKSERQREYDEKRKAEAGKDVKRELPPALQAYLKEREAEIEIYKTISPSLKPYYKSLVDDYYDSLKNGTK